MPFFKNKSITLLTNFLICVSANPLQHIYENFQAEPAEFMFNSALVIILLFVGGILAGIASKFPKDALYL